MAEVLRFRLVYPVLLHRRISLAGKILEESSSVNKQADDREVAAFQSERLHDLVTALLAAEYCDTIKSPPNLGSVAIHRLLDIANNKLVSLKFPPVESATTLRPMYDMLRMYHSEAIDDLKRALDVFKAEISLLEAKQLLDQRR